MFPLSRYSPFLRRESARRQAMVLDRDTQVADFTLHLTKAGSFANSVGMLVDTLAQSRIPFPPEVFTVVEEVVSTERCYREANPQLLKVLKMLLTRKTKG